jgi:hypothetical protein
MSKVIVLLARGICNHSYAASIVSHFATTAGRPKGRFVGRGDLEIVEKALQSRHLKHTQSRAVLEQISQRWSRPAATPATAPNAP